MLNDLGTLYQARGKLNAEAGTLGNLAQLYAAHEECVQVDAYTMQARLHCVARGYQDQLLSLERSLAMIPKVFY